MKIKDIQEEILHKSLSNIPPKPRMLVTTPSNTAIDEIIRRLMEIHFHDWIGVEYNPNIVRIGVRASKDIESVTFNVLSQSVFIIYLFI